MIKEFSLISILVFGLIFSLLSCIYMVRKKKIYLFMPFFILGAGLLLGAGFIFYDFFGIGADISFIFTFIEFAGIFLILGGVIK